MDEDDERIEVRARAEPGPYFVGQGIGVRVEVIAAEERPEVVAPSVNDADLTLIGTDLKPIVVEGIGAVVNETNAFWYDYRHVPRKEGLLVLPAFRARIDGRSGASGPLRFEVRRPPLAGRPAEFLGGVGPLRVEALARPDSARVGQEIVYELRLSGPGALGSTRRPALRGLDRLPIEPELTSLPAEVVEHPPSRTFRYRIRPLAPGEAILPPVPLATFDPGSGRYLTSWAPGVPVRVVDVPRFEPDDLSHAPLPAASTESATTRIVLEIGLGVLVLAALIGSRFWVAHRWRDPRRFAKRVARRLQGQGGAIDPRQAERIANDLARYLRKAIGRPEGALTPIEAIEGVERATDDPDLAARAGRLIAQCDRIRYAGRFAKPAETEGYAGEARALFRDLGKIQVRKGREQGQSKAGALETGGGTSDRGFW